VWGWSWSWSAPGRVRTDGHRHDPASRMTLRARPRKIEVKAYGGSARGAPVPLEQRQVDAARADPRPLLPVRGGQPGVPRAGTGTDHPRDTAPGHDRANRAARHLLATLRLTDYDEAERWVAPPSQT